MSPSFPPLEPQTPRPEPLAYRAPADDRGRPGTLTAIGVISIVLATFGLLYGVLEALDLIFPTRPVAISAQGMPTTFAWMPQHSIGVLIMTGASAGLDIVLASYLLTIGILTLRNSSKSRTLHLIYVPSKFLLAVLGVAASWAWTNAFSSQAPSARANFSIPVIWNAARCIYPIALLFALNTSAVRNYYRAARQAGSAKGHH